MIRGWYDAFGPPKLNGIVRIASLSIEWSTEFLVDTGADVSCVHYVEGIIGRQQAKEANGRPIDVTGIGGSVDYRELPATLILQDTLVGSRIYRLDLRFGNALQHGTHPLPSLLGRDVLDQHRILYYPRRRRLEMDFVS